LSTAIASHVNKLGFYPGGGWGTSWVGIPDNGTGTNQPGGWIYQILPYMDQEPLHDLGKGLGLAPSSSASLTRISLALPVLYCPTRRAPQAYPFTLTTPIQTNSPVIKAGRTDYAINGGTTPILHGTGSASMSAVANYTWPSLAGFNGIASVHSQVTDAMITDNKETTYLIGEKYLSPENYIMGADNTPTKNDPGDLNSALSGDDFSLVRWGNDNLLPNMDRTAANNPPPQPSRVFGSAHGAGWHAAFCDGHVQLVGWGIDSKIHTYMAGRNDHKVVDPSKIPH
jgi:hypothetical protein